MYKRPVYSTIIGWVSTLRWRWQRQQQQQKHQGARVDGLTHHSRGPDFDHGRHGFYHFPSPIVGPHFGKWWCTTITLVFVYLSAQGIWSNAFRQTPQRWNFTNRHTPTPQNLPSPSFLQLDLLLLYLASVHHDWCWTRDPFELGPRLPYSSIMAIWTRMESRMDFIMLDNPVHLKHLSQFTLKKKD